MELHMVHILIMKRLWRFCEGIAKIKIGLPAGSYQLITAIQNSNWYQNIQVHSTLKVTA